MASGLEGGSGRNPANPPIAKAGRVVGLQPACGYRFAELFCCWVSRPSVRLSVRPTVGGFVLANENRHLQAEGSAGGGVRRFRNMSGGKNPTDTDVRSGRETDSHAGSWPPERGKAGHAMHLANCLLDFLESATAAGSCGQHEYTRRDPCRRIRRNDIQGTYASHED